MKAKDLKNLLAYVGDDEDVLIASDAHNYWRDIFVAPLQRLEMETVVWDANGQSYRLLKEGQSIKDYEDEDDNGKHPPIRVLVLK